LNRSLEKGSRIKSRKVESSKLVKDVRSEGTDYSKKDKPRTLESGQGAILTELQNKKEKFVKEKRGKDKKWEPTW